MNAQRWFRLFIHWVAWLSVLSSPVWAQSSSQRQNKAKTVSSTTKAKVPGHMRSADITAQLQAQAVAEAAITATSGQVLSKQVELVVSAPVLSSLPIQTLQPAALLVSDRPGDVIPALEVVSSQSPELLIAQQILQGHLPCERGASVRIEADTSRPGFFNLHGQGFRYLMYPVQTSSGALRLEDKETGAVWLQLANKSMLMDQKKGKRLVDECIHPHQLAYAETMKTNPPPSLIDTTGMGRSILKP